MAERTDYRQDVATAQKPRSDYIRRDIESTRAALDEKLDALQTKVRDVQTKAKQAFDLNYQVSQHPWAMFGASIGVGFGLGLVIGGGNDEEHSWQAYPTMFDQGQLPRSSSAERFYASERRPERASSEESSERSRSPRADIFDTVKLAAGAAVTDLLRQAINHYIPQLGEQLDKIWQERGLTPMAAASALFSRGSRQQGSSEESGGEQGRVARGRGQASGGYGSTSYGSSGPDPARNFDPSAEPSRGPTDRAEATTRS